MVAAGQASGAGGYPEAEPSFWDSLRRAAPSTGASTGSRMYEQAKRAQQAEAEADGVPKTKEARSIASLAARAARASRSWKVYQDVEKAKRGGKVQLTTVSSASSMDDV